jgi:hypothetical protein
LRLTLSDSQTNSALGYPIDSFSLLSKFCEPPDKDKTGSTDDKIGLEILIALPQKWAYPLFVA